MFTQGQYVIQVRCSTCMSEASGKNKQLGDCKVFTLSGDVQGTLILEKHHLLPKSTSESKETFCAYDYIGGVSVFRAVCPRFRHTFCLGLSEITGPV